MKREGLAREVVRAVQNARKDADLDMADRIVLRLATEDADLATAIDVHREYIAAECLVLRWSVDSLGQQAYRAAVKVEGKPLVIELTKAAA